MDIHNSMEEFVFETVNEVFDEKAKSGFSLANCYQCRLDVACYVLNRIKPEYIISGRGLAHYESDYQDHLQTSADIVALVNEGLRKIDARRRPYYTNEPEERTKILSGPVYNFPAMIGRILHGTTFEPIQNINVALLRNSEPVPMIDYTWQNPYFIVESTRGHFTFLPHPEKAGETGELQVFSFEVCIETEGFTPLQHFFELKVTAEGEVRHNFSAQHTYKIGELYLFPEDVPMERNE